MTIELTNDNKTIKALTQSINRDDPWQDQMHVISFYGTDCSQTLKNILLFLKYEEEKKLLFQKYEQMMILVGPWTFPELMKM